MFERKQRYGRIFERSQPTVHRTASTPATTITIASHAAAGGMGIRPDHRRMPLFPEESHLM
jgi:hypothetical protein